MGLAAEELDVRLQVGRVLRGRWLVAAVVLRELSTLGELDLVAPSWVLVTDPQGAVVLRVPAGREPGAGPELLGYMRQDAAAKTTAAFVARWEPASRLVPLHRRLARRLRRQ